MHQQLLADIVDELSELLPGQFAGRIYQLDKYSLAIDFGLRQHGYLFISVDPAGPRLHLVRRSARELKKLAIHPSIFAQSLPATLENKRVVSVAKDADERVVRFAFAADGDSNAVTTLIAQLTGRSANLLLIDASNVIERSLREPRGAGQLVGQQYTPPPKSKGERVGAIQPIASRDKRSPSEIADQHYRSLASANELQDLATRARVRLRKKIARQNKLRRNLENDLATHGDPAAHKRLGELLLANLSTATRSGSHATLIDYFAPDLPTFDVEIDANVPLQVAATDYFSRYQKAQRAAEEIATRMAEVDRELRDLKEQQTRLEEIVTRGDIESLHTLADDKQPQETRRKKEKAPTVIPGARRYRSSDGYEILVGRTAKDNDQLTFRVARPNDLWLHAGDYPGSHVIVRNASRNEVPHRTIVEAAQLAAKFSQASNDSKVNIHYTQRKFLAKPKGAAPGLVRMSRFKSMTVQPAENIERMK